MSQKAKGISTVWKEMKSKMLTGFEPCYDVRTSSKSKPSNKNWADCKACWREWKRHVGRFGIFLGRRQGYSWPAHCSQMGFCASLLSVCPWRSEETLKTACASLAQVTPTEHWQINTLAAHFARKRPHSIMTTHRRDGDGREHDHQVLWTGQPAGGPRPRAKDRL